MSDGVTQELNEPRTDAVASPIDYGLWALTFSYLLSQFFCSYIAVIATQLIGDFHFAPDRARPGPAQQPGFSGRGADQQLLWLDRGRRKTGAFVQRGHLFMAICRDRGAARARRGGLFFQPGRGGVERGL